MATRTDILDNLVTQLGNLDTIKTCTLSVLPLDTAKKSAPYIAVVAGSQVTSVENATHTRHSLDVDCFLITDGTTHPIESTLDDIQNLIDSIDLGSACRGCIVIGISPVQRTDPKVGDRYATVVINLFLVYVVEKGVR